MAEARGKEGVTPGSGSGPHIISSESIVVPVAAGAVAAAAAGAARGAGAAAGAELGRRLLLAARAGDAQLVLDLMAQGAPFTTDWLGTSPLHLAAAGGHAGAAAVLLRAGVSRDARTKVDRTPLHLAAHAGHARLAALLLDHGALPDCRDMLRMTPLHWACARGHVETATLLARRGADPHARCKFRRTPLQLCPAAMRPALLAALRERAAAPEEMAVDEGAVVEQKFETVQMPFPVEEKPVAKSQHRVSKPVTETESGEAEGRGGAAALLRQHGITLLPADDGSTVLSALQSGRTVVLSDAGKLMLKESSSPPLPSPSPSPAPRVVLRATPARSPPRPGVKVFTVNKLPARLAPPAAASAPAPAPAPAAAAAPAQLRKVLDPQDMQIKYVQLSPEPTVLAAAKPPAKATAKLARAAGGPGAAGGAGPAGGAGGRPGVKIIMNKASFSKLLATAARAHDSGDNEPLAALSGGGEAVVCVPEQFVRSMSARYLRAQLLAAHAALAAMSRELRRARAGRAHSERRT